MRTRTIFHLLSITGVIAISSARAQAHSPVAEPQTISQESRADEHQNSAPRDAIVGSWMGTVGNGHIAVNSFTSDGVMLGSSQGEVSLSLVQTAIHGAWTYLGERRFAVTAVGLGYDIQTGEYYGFIKIHLVLRLNAAGDRMTGTERVELFGPDGGLASPFPPGRVQFARIEVEPLN